MSRRTTYWKHRKVRQDKEIDTAKTIKRFSPGMSDAKVQRIAAVLHRDR